MTSIATSRPTLSPRLRRAALIALLVAVAAAGAFGLVRALGDGQTKDGSPVVTGPPEAPFELSHPDSWQPVAKADLAGLPGSPLAVVRRKDGQATIVIDRKGSLEGGPKKLAAGLRRDLRKRFPDFKEVSATTTTIAAGQAFVYAFARTKEGTAQTIVLVPSGDTSYSLNAVVRPRAPEAAREVGAMIASFDVKGK